MMEELNRKPMYESCTFNESYPSLEKTEIHNTTSFEQSPGKKLIAHDCEANPLYGNQEGCNCGYAERKSYWDTHSEMSFVRGAVLISHSNAWFSSTQSATFTLYTFCFHQFYPTFF